MKYAKFWKRVAIDYALEINVDIIHKYQFHSLLCINFEVGRNISF